MLIVSWNVAGLATTVHRINESYKDSSSNNNNLNSEETAVSSTSSDVARKRPRSLTVASKTRSSALLNFIKRHKADIICFQEHKIPLSQLSARAEPLGCASSAVEGHFETFWSCCVDGKKRGLNGVVSYSPVGTVLRADPAPLGCPTLGQQGRCIMTDHGSFVLFNVYVPASGGQPLSYKMKFLNALRRAMKRQREEKGKPVILVGDLNITHSGLDIYWKDRVVAIDEVLQQVRDASEATSPNIHELPQWKRDVAQHWQTIEKALQKREAVAKQTKNPTTGETFDKFQVCFQRSDGRRVFLGRPETSPECAMWYYGLNHASYFDEDEQEEVLAQEANIVSVSTLAELMVKIANIEWNEETQRAIASTEAGARKVSPTRTWLNNLLEVDGMVDTFRHFYPKAEGRFTCWNQYTNRRYTNEGCRLDYILLDQSLLQYVRKGDVPCLRRSLSTKDPLGEDAALSAAMANGLFQPVSFHGEGIESASKRALDTQFGDPHTGMIYTPPSYSDHIAVSLLVDLESQQGLALDEADQATRKAQPHKSQPSIASFFGAKCAILEGSGEKKSSSAPGARGIRSNDQRSMFAFVSQGESSTGIAKRTKTRQPKKRNTILSHFQKR